jgi:hypothetical protein
MYKRKENANCTYCIRVCYCNIVYLNTFSSIIDKNLKYILSIILLLGFGFE